MSRQPGAEIEKGVDDVSTVRSRFTAGLNHECADRRWKEPLNLMVDLLACQVQSIARPVASLADAVGLDCNQHFSIVKGQFVYLVANLCRQMGEGGARRHVGYLPAGRQVVDVGWLLAPSSAIATTVLALWLSFDCH